jgi:hypothetical protein
LFFQFTSPLGECKSNFRCEDCFARAPIPRILSVGGVEIIQISEWYRAPK